MAVRVQEADFDLGTEVARLTSGNTSIGALVTFTGLVRDLGGADAISALELEHYPAMTAAALERIEAEACARWALQESLIIHRYGRLEPGAQIMMVATAAPHRGDAFAAAEFLMDFLKSRAPFWKKEHGADGARWVDARESDEAALNRWT
ncbi:molybdenum cofactor biosynthesis protein MoaE [Oceanomicrobium pacificus]|uniref:Molybdopterin synthase catalytic subunit n=1 Tax=Oceanomicrobium pacificus TaxID=2692916 RepID=A0A6B0TS25_9RHOB|nr:molybdenum cofactor biosynthesis protein MoaE [Oceanomicrobium pacificus]MXU66786.1 molybdenum cofactor biosynthesis protein MoaE [Oceanomicrobium pacificus]